MRTIIIKQKSEPRKTRPFAVMSTGKTFHIREQYITLRTKKPP